MLGMPSFEANFEDGAPFPTNTLLPRVRGNTRIRNVINFPPPTHTRVNVIRSEADFSFSGKWMRRERRASYRPRNKTRTSVWRPTVNTYIHVLLGRPYYRWSGLRFTGERIKTTTTTTTIKTVRVRRDERAACARCIRFLTYSLNAGSTTTDTTTAIIMVGEECIR